MGAFTQEHEVGIRRLPTASSPKLRQVPKPGSRSKFCRSDRTRMTGSQSGAHCIIGHQGRAAFPRRPEGRTSAQCEVVAPCSPLGHLFLTEFWIADVLTEARRGWRRSSRQQCHGNRAPVPKGTARPYFPVSNRNSAPNGNAISQGQLNKGPGLFLRLGAIDSELDFSWPNRSLGELRVPELRRWAVGFP